VPVKNDETDFNAAWGDVDAVKILSKPVNVASFAGKDGYVLAFNETTGEFYLKASSSGGGGDFVVFMGKTWDQIFWAYTIEATTITPIY
jgi:hypothetical protein